MNATQSYVLLQHANWTSGTGGSEDNQFNAFPQLVGLLSHICRVNFSASIDKSMGLSILVIKMQETKNPSKQAVLVSGLHSFLYHSPLLLKFPQRLGSSLQSVWPMVSIILPI